MTTLAPHHDGSALHVSNTAPSVGDVVTVRLRIPEGFAPVAEVLVRSTPDTEMHFSAARHVGLVDGWNWWSADIVIANPRHRYRWFLLLDDGGVLEYNQGGLSEIEALDVFDFAIVAHNPPPSWMDDAVMYQIVPDRFARSQESVNPVPDWAMPAESWDEPQNPVMPARVRQYYGGDLDGVVEKLDHLEEIGVNLLYHTPIFPAGSNHRYDSSDFHTVDPSLGGEAAYLRLIEAVHARGMRIMGDLTTNHSGDRHEWFRAAISRPDAPEREFYYFLEDDEKGVGYETWLGAQSLPKFNWNSAELRRRFIEGPDSVVATWLAEPYRTDGWRIDVANMTGRLREVDLNEDVRTTLRRTMVDVNPDTLLIAEYTNNAAADFQGDAWHGAMTYPGFTRATWNWLAEPRVIHQVNAQGEEVAESWFFGLPGGLRSGTARQFVEQLERFTAELPWRVRTGGMLALNSHDTARFATYADDAHVPLAVGLSMTLPGIPVVYAGDEFALTAPDGEASRSPIPWHRRDEPQIAARIALYRDLIGMRRAHRSLQGGGLRWVHADETTLVFVRESADEAVLVIAATADVAVEVPAVLVPGAGEAERLYGEVAVEARGDVVRFSGAGPVFGAWRLPGVHTPEAVAAPIVARSAGSSR
ncbi:MAG: glycoside hydrolase family 13 protein [Microbacterium sp.]